MPSKNGAQAAYTASDLTNDIRTGLVAIIPPEDWEEEHEERLMPKREQRIEPPTKTEVASVSREHKVMARATKPDMANTSTVSREQHAEAADQTEAPRVAAANASCGPIWQADGSTPTEPPEGAPLHRWSPGRSSSLLIESALMINKKCRGTEQPLVMVEWDMARAFISATATEKLDQCELGVYEDEGLTVKDAWGMDLTPLRIPEAPVLKTLLAGALEKCKWRNAIGGSGGVQGEHHHGSSHHAAPGQGPVRYWSLGEANVCVTKRGDQADASSAYSVRKVDVDAHGSPVRTLVRKTSWYDATQVIKAADGKLAVTIDWEWFEQYRERLLAKQASGKKITPEIYQRHLLPDERLLTLVANTYGRKAGGHIWQDHLTMLLVGPHIHAKRPDTKADMRCNLRSTTELLPDSVEKGMPEGGAVDSPSGCTSRRCDSPKGYISTYEVQASKNRERSRQRTKQSYYAWLSLTRCSHSIDRRRS